MTNKPQFVGERVRLGDVCTIVSGATPKTKTDEYWGGEIKWITPAELNGDSHYISDTEKHLTVAGYRSASLHMMPKGTVLLTTRAPIGKVAIATEEMCCNQGFKNLVCSAAINNEFLFLYLKSRTVELQAMGRGATFKELSKKNIAEFEINLPSIDRQLDAVAKLTAVGNQIACAKQQLEQLDSLVKSRFVEMFENGKTDTVRLGDWCEKITKGTTPTTAGYSFIDDGINFIKVETLSDSGDFIPDKLAHISCECHAALKRSQLKEGDLLFSIAGAIGRIAIVTSDVMPANTNQALAIIRLNKNAPFELSFLKQALSSSAVVAVAEKLKRGVAQINLSLKDVGNFLIPCPDMETQRDYSACVSQVDKSRFVYLGGKGCELLLKLHFRQRDD